MRMQGIKNIIPAKSGIVNKLSAADLAEIAVHTPQSQALAVAAHGARTKRKAIAQTLGFSGREGFKYNCPHDYKSHASTPYTVSLDWLQMGIVLAEGADGLNLGEDFTRGHYRYVCRPVGTQHYQFCYDIFKGNDQLFTLEIKPRNKSRKEDNNALIRFENWTLYADWFSIWSDFAETNVKEVLRLSRVDIALDGLNHIYDLMNDFMSRKSDGFAVKLIGKSKVRPGDISRITRVPEWYKIGTPKGLKQIAIYNKSLDIERTSKNHIKHFWEANGLTTMQANYRFEMRMKSDYLKQLSGDKLGAEYNPVTVLQALTSDAFKVDIVRKACDSFFEWIYGDDKNASRCTRLNLLPSPEHDLKRKPLVYNGTAYKAKMQVHNTFFQVAKGIVGREEGIAIIGTQLHVYELHSWYCQRMFDFAKKYQVECAETLDELMFCAMPLTATSDQLVKREMSEIWRKKNPKQMKLRVTEIYNNYTRIRTI